MDVVSELDVVTVAADLLRGRTWIALTGAGISTDSGIPDYRGPTSARATPMQFSEFVGSAEAQRRYWARSYQGWRRIGRAEPNAGHRALVELESHGLQGVITQNVDGLHQAAGSRTVVNLHGDISRVVCLDCERPARRGDSAPAGRTQPTRRAARARSSTPNSVPTATQWSSEWHDFILAGCPDCGGRLKPDVVFFGESVPRDRVDRAYALVEAAEVLVVLGSSLTVMSGLRFVRHQAKYGRPVVIINRGVTRGDPLATLKIDGGCSETLTRLAAGPR